MTMTLDCQGQILKMLYLRNGRADWQGTKGMWVDRMLYPHCDFELWPHLWPWPWNGRANQQRMKGIWGDRMLYLLCDLELWLCPWILKVKFKKSSSIGIRWIDIKGCESIGCWTQVMTLKLLPHQWPWPSIFKFKFLKSHNSEMGCPIDMEHMGSGSIGC